MKYFVPRPVATHCVYSGALKEQLSKLTHEHFNYTAAPSCSKVE